MNKLKATFIVGVMLMVSAVGLTAADFDSDFTGPSGQGYLIYVNKSDSVQLWRLHSGGVTQATTVISGNLTVTGIVTISDSLTLDGAVTHNGAVTSTNNQTFNLGVFIGSAAIAVTNNQTLTAAQILVSVLELDSGGGIQGFTNTVSLPDPGTVGKILMVIVDAASTNAVLLPASDSNIENQTDIVIEDGGEPGVLLYATDTDKWRSIQ